MLQKSFSLVTTCRNEIKSLPRWKANLIAQDRFPDEIVVVDAFSDDGTYEFLVEWQKNEPRLKIHQAKGNAAIGRNLAISYAIYEIILSTDMGVRLSNNWCSSLIGPFERDYEVEVVAGNTCIDIETLTSVFARAEYYIENGGIPKLEAGFIIGNRSCAYNKSVWKRLNGLPEDLTFYADDSVFGRQVVEGGFVMALAPEAMTFWARPNRLRDFWKEQVNYGRGGGEALIKMPYFFRTYRERKMPWLLALLGNGLWNTYKQANFGAFRRALKARDLTAVFVIPILAFGNGYYRMKGYKLGVEHGNLHCQECRKRLKWVW
jgi:cellulose synthase/poly-beta-1,6-N-acetylglucosamine synthase-like glycosyltransferase